MYSVYNKIINHAGFKKYFYNTSWMFTEQILRLISGLLVGVWVARYLGPEKFGIFSYVIAFSSIFSCISKLGLDDILVRNLVNEESSTDVYLGTSFWLKIFGAIITFLVLIVATLFSGNDSITNIYIYIISIGFIFQSFGVIDLYFQSRVLSKNVSLCKMIQLLISSFLKVYFVITGAGLLWFVIVSLIDQITLAITLYIAHRLNKLTNFYKKFDIKIAKILIKDSWPLIFSSLLVMIYIRIDQIMIKEMLGPKEVGLYSVAVRLSEIWYFIPVIITNSLFPAILNARKISVEFYHKRLQKLYSLMVWLAIGIAIPVSLFSTHLIVFLYGSEYHEAGDVLMIHIWTGVFVFIGVAFSRYLTAENLTKKSFYRTLLGACTNIILNLVSIPYYGIYAAAISTLISEVMANYVYDFFDKDVFIQLKLKTLAIINPLLIRGKFNYKNGL